jgi:hypothetical protein
MQNNVERDAGATGRGPPVPHQKPTTTPPART